MLTNRMTDALSVSLLSDSRLVRAFVRLCCHLFILAAAGEGGTHLCSHS